MLEEKIGDLHSFRKNLLLISVLNILIVIFAGNIKDINFLFFKLENINSITLLSILLITNLYAIWRYWQYLKITPINKNLVFTFKEIVNTCEHKIITPNGLKKLIIDNNWDVIQYLIGLGGQINTSYKNIIKDDTISFNIVKNELNDFSHTLLVSKKNSEQGSTIYQILFNEKDLKKTNFIFSDKYYADKIGVYILGWLGVFLIFFKIYYLSLTNLCNL